MKNLFLFLAFIVFAICASAQKVYFIYLQSDNSGPFYLKVGDKIYSSSASGYLILSNLVDSSYNFSIGFPSSKSESKFMVPLEAKDKGFLIKNFDFGLGLFDLQRLTVIRELKDDSPQNISYIRRNDDFSSLLSKAAKDTSLLYAIVRVKEEDVAMQKVQPKAIDTVEKNEGSVLPKDTVGSNSPQTSIALAEQRQDTIEMPQSNSDTKAIENIVNKDREENAITSAERVEPIDSTTNVEPDTVSNGANISSIPLAAEEIVFKKSIVKKY
jgi:hypothetical protein